MFFNKSKRNEEKASATEPWQITKGCLKMILESSKDVFPNEFGGLLSVDDYDKKLITEIVMLPGTISGNSHAIFQMHMRPIDFSIVGTVHSHPSSYANPSNADLDLFRKYGQIHMIVASPYEMNSWKAYTQKGEKTIINVI